MKSATLAACAGLALAGSVWLGSALVSGGSARSQETPGAGKIVPVAALAAEAGGLFDADPSRVCVQAFSKDICESVLEHGELRIGACDEANCRTAYVSGAPLYFYLQHNPQGCSSDGRCDEVPEKDGWLEARVTYTLRLQDPCALRGFISGRWQHIANDGEVYKGTMTGTLGVGTHRKFECQQNTERQCERCLDVEFIEDQGLWRIAVEASFAGVDSKVQDLHFTLSGDFYAKGDANGPFEFGGWRFVGSADGAHVVYCH